MIDTYKKQVIAVSEIGKVMLLSQPNYGISAERMILLLEEEKLQLPAGIYVADILLLHGGGRNVDRLDIDINYALAEYRDFELYSGECKLT